MPVSRENGLKIYYEVAGTGPPLVLIHALPFDHNLWLYQVERFSARFRTITIGLRGWGRSDKPRTPFTLADMVNDVLGVLADAGAGGDAVVLGCSIGSKIALMLACEHPEVFRAAILVGGNSGPQPQLEHRAVAYRAHGAAGTLSDYHLAHLRFGVTQAWADTPIGRYLLAGFVERGRSLDAECIAQVFRALTVSDVTPKLLAYRTPTLIVNGEHDNARPGGTRTAALIPHAQHEILRGTGHCCFIEDPETFNALVQSFLERHGLWPQQLA
jgi:pimeloyl-ACP methyl ester carboxylesterase